jgi:hypothetical protein
MKKPRASLAALLALAVLAVAAVAMAQSATIIVQVRTSDGSPGEATVTLTPEQGGAAHSCRTSSGTCRLSGLPVGRYVVTAQPSGGGEGPVARVVPVPPAGEMTVAVRLR